MSKIDHTKISHIFPLTVFKTKLGLKDEEREILIKEIYIQEKQSKNKKKDKSWTGDQQGFEFLFLNEKFNQLFILISNQIKEYAITLGLNSKKIDFYYQRAWATLTTKDQNIAIHSHTQSHITFAYYLKKNKDDGKLIFHNEHNPNEIARGAFSGNLTSAELVNPNYSNASKVSFSPELDDIIIFPSKTLHSTLSNKSAEDRISISGDISIVAKNSENLEILLTPINKWKKF